MAVAVSAGPAARLRSPYALNESAYVSVASLITSPTGVAASARQSLTPRSITAPLISPLCSYFDWGLKMALAQTDLHDRPSFLLRAL